MSFKKISAIFLIAVALMLSWNMSVFPEENTVSAEAAADKAIISQLGLFDFSDREDVPITRAEFAMAAYQIMCFGSQNTPVGRGDLYSDVGQWHWAAGYIEYLTERAVLNGVEPGVFDPDAPITVEQAC